MRTTKNVRLVAIAMLIIMFEPVFALYIDDDHQLPDAPISEAQMYFDTIPEEKRDEFIRFFLGKGLQQQQAFTPYAALDGSNNIEKEFGVPPRGFTSNLLDWTKSTFQLSDNHVLTLVEGASYVCHKSGCFNPLEIGAHCCPF